MICPHCGKEIESSINNITLNGAAPGPNFTWIPLNHVGAAVTGTYVGLGNNTPINLNGTAGENPTKLIYDVGSGTWKTQGAD